ncbi:MAG: 16S rRNA (cytosine(1402)-N(4))-methyltransferase RsmH [Syntrophomonadaceae bacterium]
MHQPVLLMETISYLITEPNGVYIDCTVGGGGHLSQIIQNTDNNARIIGIDRDKETLERIKQQEEYSKVTFIHDDFRNLTQILKKLNLDKVNGILLDLGVSSMQLDTASRGFSYHEDAFLDMRMDIHQNLTARDIVNSYSEEDLRKILFDYGEERYGRSIAHSIVEYRKKKEIVSTLELVDIIKSSVSARYSRDKHPARRSFQALRIAVNGELEAIEMVLPAAIYHLIAGGRLCIITFHSLEDRIVKKFMQEKAKSCICPPGLPICTCGHERSIKILTRKPITPGDVELNNNPRARSAKLRIAEKL